MEAVGAKRAPNAYYFVPLAAFDSIRLAILVTPLTKRKQPLPEAMAPDSTNMAIGRALEILDLQVRQQAFTLAITDSFKLVAWSAACCLIVIACMAPVPKQYRQLLAASKPN